MLIVESQSLDVYRNLAIEEYLMEHAVDHGPVLFLWQSDCAVVIGKNQNPWRECRLDLMRAQQVPLARRISGGGTVYHDTGNLNYCVIVDRVDYSEQAAYDLVLRALETLGISAEKTGKSNLSVDGLKFSGNAFCFRKGRALHHGTLLMHTDLERLNRYLGSMFEEIQTHAIASIPAKVMNLEVGIDELSGALKESFLSSNPAELVSRWTPTDLDPDLLEPLVLRQHAVEWQFGATPRFRLNRPGGYLEVVKDRIVDADGSFARDGLMGRRFSEIAFSSAC